MGLEHFVSTIPTNLIYGQMGAPIRTQQRGPHFTGFLPLALATVAVAAWLWRGSTDAAELLPTRVFVPASGLLFMLFAAFALGRNIVWNGRYLAPGPYQLLYYFVPGFAQVRIPERLALIAMLFLAVLAARGMTILSRRLPWPFVAALALLVPLEHLSPQADAPRLRVGGGVPSVYRFLAQSNARAVAEVPIHGEGLVRSETLDMYFSSNHWKPIVHGYTAYPPLVTRLLRRAAAQFPADVALQAFQRVGVDTVVVHQGRGIGADLARQFPGVGEERDERFRRALRSAGLDLYGQLPGAIQAGLVTRLAVFEGPAARLFESTRDEVYRIAPAERRAGARFPAGPRLNGRRWTFEARTGEPMLAMDGSMETAWVSPDSIQGDEFFAVRFDVPLLVGGLVLPLRWDTPFPTRFRIEGRDAEGSWSALARYDGSHMLQLLDRALQDPRSAAIGFELNPRELLGMRLVVEAGGTSFDGWSIPELELLGPEP
jgi:hypothetical protein